MRFPWTKKSDESPVSRAEVLDLARQEASTVARAEASEVARHEGRTAALESVSTATEDALGKIEKSVIERASLAPVPDTNGI